MQHLLSWTSVTVHPEPLQFVHFGPSTSVRYTVSSDTAHFVRSDGDRRDREKARGEVDNVQREREITMFPEPATEQSVVVRDPEILEQMEPGRGRYTFRGMAADGMGSRLGDGQCAQRVLVGDGRDRGVVWTEQALESGNKLKLKLRAQSDEKYFALFLDGFQLSARCRFL